MVVIDRQMMDEIPEYKALLNILVKAHTYGEEVLNNLMEHKAERDYIVEQACYTRVEINALTVHLKYIVRYWLILLPKSDPLINVCFHKIVVYPDFIQYEAERHRASQRPTYSKKFHHNLN